jgi:hypothetical protein
VAIFFGKGFSWKFHWEEFDSGFVFTISLASKVLPPPEKREQSANLTLSFEVSF